MAFRIAVYFCKRCYRRMLVNEGVEFETVIGQMSLLPLADKPFANGSKYSMNQIKAAAEAAASIGGLLVSRQ
jgi:hypothetical protein